MGSERTDRSRALIAVTAAAALFCIVLIFLAQQLRAGRDPAIGAGKPTAAAAPRHVIVAPSDRDAGHRRRRPRPRSRRVSARGHSERAGATAPAPAPVVSRGS